MSSFRLALLSLWRRRFALGIAVTTIALSAACGGILLRLYRLSESRFSTLARGVDAVIGAKAGGIEILLGSLHDEGRFPGFLPQNLFETLKARATVRFEDGATAESSEIRSIIPFLYFARLDDFRVVATDDGLLTRSNPLVVKDGRWFASAGEIVLGASAARGHRVGENVTAKAWLGDDIGGESVPLTVVGILAPTGTAWDRLSFASLEQGRAVLAAHDAFLRRKSIWGPNVLQYFLVELRRDPQGEPRPGGFDSLEALINRRTVGQIIDVKEETRRLEELTGAGKQIGLFVTLFVLALGGLSVAALLMTRFESMTVQLSVLRALGYSRHEISAWLLWEGLLLGLGGCVLGAVLDAAALPFLRGLLGGALPPADLIDVSLWASAPIWIGVCVAIVLAVTIPLLRLERFDTHQSLRGL